MSEQLWICEYKKHMTPGQAIACKTCAHSERHEKLWNCDTTLPDSVCPKCVPVTDTEEERDDG